MLPAFWPLRNRLRLITSAVASWTGSHSRTMDVCVALRQRRTGADGSDSPKERKIESCRWLNESCDSLSDSKLRATVMSTMLPDEMCGGSRMDGNSICLYHRWCQLGHFLGHDVAFVD